ncbi:MAG: TetR/AcrR family transcriptional regulator [Deltaproteobacteria bacterium]|nr:TetR/AcrR family transcriptional regulator [Deltaproteobacteria bacterium]
MDRKELILNIALDLFTQWGYFNTTVHDIQRASNVSIGSIYHHFKNKEGIAKALFDRLVAQMDTAIEGILRTHESTYRRSLAIITYLFELAKETPQSMQYILYARHREFMPDEKPICSSRPFEKIKAMVREGIEKGEIRPMDPTVASACLFGGAIRLIHLHLDRVLEKELPAYLEEVFESAWRSVAT